jgi:hypothetical protein
MTTAYDLEMAITHLSYDDMMDVAEYVGIESGILTLNPDGSVTGDVSSADIARGIRSYASILEGVRVTHE